MCAQQNKAYLQQQLDSERERLECYLDLSTDMTDDEAYVARGNGFCDAKYSEDFLEGQIASIQANIADLERRLATLADD